MSLSINGSGVASQVTRVTPAAPAGPTSPADGAARPTALPDASALPALGDPLGGSSKAPSLEEIVVPDAELHAAGSNYGSGGGGSGGRPPRGAA